LRKFEFGEYMVRNSKIPINNPPGFYIRLIQGNTSIPETFETAAKRKLREERERRERDRDRAQENRRILEDDYDSYCYREIDRYVAENPEAYKAIMNAKWRDNRERFPTFSPEMITSMANSEARREERRQLPLVNIEEFALHREQGSVVPHQSATTSSEVDENAALPFLAKNPTQLV